MPKSNYMYKALYNEKGGMATRAGSSIAFIIAQPNGIVKAIAIFQSDPPTIEIPSATPWVLDKGLFFTNTIEGDTITLLNLGTYNFTLNQEIGRTTDKIKFNNSDDFTQNFSKGGKAKKNQSKKNRSKKNRSKKNRNSRRR